MIGYSDSSIISICANLHQYKAQEEIVKLSKKLVRLFFMVEVQQDEEPIRQL